MKIDFLSDINKGYEVDLNYKGVDHFIIKVLWWHFALFLILVVLNAVVKIALFLPSPLAWRVISIPEAIVTILISIVATGLPAVLCGRIKNHYLWRIIVTFALTFYSYLFIFISGGSIEMHFHFFMMAGLLVVYSDWRLGWILLVLTALHHTVLNFIAPGWVYFYGRNDIAVIAHAVPVLVAIIFTTMLCQMNRRSITKLTGTQKGLEANTAQLEKLKNGLESTVAKRTMELNDKIAELERMNKYMINREVRMVELKKEIAALGGEEK